MDELYTGFAMTYENATFDYEIDGFEQDEDDGLLAHVSYGFQGGGVLMPVSGIDVIARVVL